MRHALVPIERRQAGDGAAKGRRHVIPRQARTRGGAVTAHTRGPGIDRNEKSRADDRLIIQLVCQTQARLKVQVVGPGRYAAITTVRAIAGEIQSPQTPPAAGFG